MLVSIVMTQMNLFYRKWGLQESHPDITLVAVNWKINRALGCVTCYSQRIKSSPVLMNLVAIFHCENGGYKFYQQLNSLSFRDGEIKLCSGKIYDQRTPTLFLWLTTRLFLFLKILILLTHMMMMNEGAHHM